MHLGYKAGTNLGQQAWEALAILVAVREWRPVWMHGRVSLAIRSDNVGALTAVAADGKLVSYEVMCSRARP